MSRIIAPKLLCLVLSCGLLLGCGHHRKAVKLPPVTNGWQQSSAGRNAYIVQSGDSLYSIAWAFDIDYRDLIQINNLKSPYNLQRGQRLFIYTQQHKKHSATATTTKLFTRDTTKLTQIIKGWTWPAKGKIVATFNNKPGGNKGIDIGGNYNTPVYASNSGKVVYSGTGIRSYGKLLIIKHNDEYLSAYAYNSSMLVREGQTVTRGQKIATMGRDDAGSTRLHFEIRRAGKPVDPRLFLSLAREFTHVQN